MIKSLTIVFTTARNHPEVGWFLDSLNRETGGDYSNTSVTIVDSFRRGSIPIYRNALWIGPKPTIWQGEHRITSEDWWAKCNALNTGIALCDTEWIAFVDDRSVLTHGWLQCVQDSMIHGYAVCGSYEKRANMRVVNGEIMDDGELLGHDDRPQRGFPVPTVDWYGGSCALPLEWCLRVNGFPENVCDGLGFEDVAFGILLRNNNFPCMYDSRMKLIEDRTPTEIGGALKRASKPSPDPDNKYLAKDYRILDIMRNSTTSGNSYDIRELRNRTLKGEPFPLSSASHFDWYDNTPINEMT
jgi:Glycosyl transferase family 2